MKPEGELEKWVPQYEFDYPSRDGGPPEKRQAVVEDAQQEECPMSIILRHREMNSLVTDVLNSSLIQQNCGSPAFGTDSSKWPARWFDAVRVAVLESRSVESAVDKAAR